MRSQGTVLKMSMQLPDGRKGTVHALPGDNPKDLAAEFCKRHTFAWLHRLCLNSPR